MHLQGGDFIQNDLQAVVDLLVLVNEPEARIRFTATSQNVSFHLLRVCCLAEQLNLNIIIHSIEGYNTGEGGAREAETNPRTAHAFGTTACVRILVVSLRLLDDRSQHCCSVTETKAHRVNISCKYVLT